MNIPKVEGQAGRANSREELMNCCTGIPSLDAGLRRYSLLERKQLADRIFGESDEDSITGNMK